MVRPASRESSSRRGPPRSGRAAEDRVFLAIQDAILDHRLKPGTKLGERELSELLGASRGAVRNALARLGHSLLVELRPNRGAVIANPTEAETRDVFEARRRVESSLLELLAERLDAPRVKALREFVAEESAAYERGDLKAGQRLSIRFHKLLAEQAGNGELDRFMEHLICRTPLLTLAHGGAPGAYCGAQEHVAIVEALAKRDPARAVRLMKEHLDRLESALHLGEAARPAERALAAALNLV